MDKSLIAERFSKAITTYSQEANVQRLIADKMIHLLQEHLSTPCPNVIEFGCGTGIYSRMLLQNLRPKSLLLNDLCEDMKYCCEDLLKEQQVAFLPGDAETIFFPNSSSLITSCSTLQWFESPEKFFQRCNTLLNEQGYFAFSTFGKDNMKEVRELTGNGLPYRSRKELEGALSPHFDILHSEEEIIPLRFENPMKVLYHLKQTGVTGLSIPVPLHTEQDHKIKEHLWTRGDLHHFCECYTRQFSQGSTVSLTYHPIYIIAKKKKV
ncbi:malonyl-ACP O-methyltransferase BioC [Bacteroides sp.]|uniref:malonyl-ACP O-methyltransferase BioC n=1 Tax=Bacteroides sp. TaxID=29523 RepID=UPI002625939C|nr:malonyl-ACP O-methyltransferase BioC [Bacteroides sp.]MDD3037833.1 malonyl-ACP O-methyltransferase BioC [Bacteroides sp.]